VDNVFKVLTAIWMSLALYDKFTSPTSSGEIEYLLWAILTLMAANIKWKKDD